MPRHGPGWLEEMMSRWRFELCTSFGVNRDKSGDLSARSDDLNDFILMTEVKTILEFARERDVGLRAG